MKHLNFLLSCAFMAVFAFVLISCSKNDEPVAEPTESLKVTNREVLAQSIYANSTTCDNVLFTTAGAWQSSVIEADADVTRAIPDWITISPTSGSIAGDYSISFTIEMNTTGVDRAASVVLTCGDVQEVITITQKCTKENGKVFIPFDYDAANGKMLEAYNRTKSNMLLIDIAIANEADVSAFADLASLANFSFTDSHPLITDLWDSSYAVINYANSIVNDVENALSMSAEEQNFCIGNAAFYRAAAYAVLLNYFGGVPLVTTADDTSLPRSSIEETRAFVLADCDRAIAQGIADLKYPAMQLKARVALAGGDYQLAADLTDEIMAAGVFDIPDTHNEFFAGADNLGIDVILLRSLFPDEVWGAVEYDDIDYYPMRFTETLLTAIEAALHLNDHDKAVALMENSGAFGHISLDKLTIDHLNHVLSNEWISHSWSGLVSHSIIGMGRQGLTVANLKRMGTFVDKLSEYGAQEHHLWLPIPASAIAQNPAITQNPGY